MVPGTRLSLLFVVVVACAFAAPAAAGTAYIAPPKKGSEPKTAPATTASTPSARPTVSPPGKPQKPAPVAAKAPAPSKPTATGAPSKPAVKAPAKPSAKPPAAPAKPDKGGKPGKGVPELDARSSGAGLALLLGGVLVLWERRRRPLA